MKSAKITDSRWLFTAEKLNSTPSIKRGMSQREELGQRQSAACLIRKIGLKLKESCKRPSGLCIDTAMVFMHRFYMFHPFQNFPAHVMAPCALFLAAKVEETPVKLEYVIKTAHIIRNPSAPPLNEKMFEEHTQMLIRNENLLLQTLGFDLVVYHPHTLIIGCGDLVGAPKIVTKLAYELATNSLHFTTMCLKYNPTMVASICLHMAFKKFSLSIEKSKEGKYWWNYLDENLTFDIIEEKMREFVAVIGTCKIAFNRWVSVKNHPEVASEGGSSGPKGMKQTNIGGGTTSSSSGSSGSNNNSSSGNIISKQAGL